MTGYTPDEVGEIRGISFIKIETAPRKIPFSGLKKAVKSLEESELNGGR